jgi:DNA-binding response OmpR family regulator
MSKKVLLADDSVTIQRVVKIILADGDYALHVADNGDTALAMAQSDRPDIVLADVYMPGKNGYELCAAIKQEPALAGVPVLLLSGTFEAFDESKALAAGADGWIAKPFESMALIEQIDGVLARSASAVTLPEAIAEVNDIQEPPALEPDMWADLEVDTLQAESSEEFLAEVTGGDGETIDEVELEADGLWDDEPLLDQDEKTAVLVEEQEDEQNVQIDDLDFDQIDEVNFADADLAASDVADELPEEVLLLDENDLLIEDDIDTDANAEEETFEFVTLDEVSRQESAAESVEELADNFLTVDEIPDESQILDSVAEPVIAEEPVSVVEEEIVADVLPEPESSADPDLMESSEPIAEPVAAKVDTAVNGLSFFSNSSLISKLAGNQEPALETAVVSAREPEPQGVALSKEAVVERVQGLSEQELTTIVEQVAGKVIEQLAATMLERIAWEVVPDLAESLIKQEISRITAVKD